MQRNQVVCHHFRDLEKIQFSANIQRSHLAASLPIARLLARFIANAKKSSGLCTASENFRVNIRRSHLASLLRSIFNTRTNEACTVLLAMSDDITCAGLECTKLCLAPRIIAHIKEQGFLPALLSPCMYSAGAPYWSWANRYHGDLIAIHSNVSEYPHFNTKWKVSMHFSS
jgi:hypothetical protein